MQQIGIDIVELDRLINPKEGFVKHVLSKQEIECYDNYDGDRKIEYLGGRFAAKEAIIKCLSEIEIPNMNEIVILNNSNGRPYVTYKNYKIEVSISHEKHYATAVAILIRDEG